MADLNEALRLAPDRAALFMRRGGVYFDGGDAERALPDFLEALRLDPGHPSNHYNHGLAAERLGRTAEAVALPQGPGASTGDAGRHSRPAAPWRRGRSAP